MTAHYLTTPIYYANDVPHIGHAYTSIAADAVARYHRLRGRDVFLLTGLDEHGINIERIAAARGLTPQQHVDRLAASFRDLWAQLDISYDRFIRTTEPAHRRAALELWRRLQSSGDLYRGVYEGAYCSRCEAYYQKEDLLGQDCPIHRLRCEQVEEENWFFRLSRYQDTLDRLVRETDFVQPAARRNEVVGILNQGLRDFSVTRTRVRWGIRVPDAPDEVLYVWVDALANYLTGVGFPDEPSTFGRYWPADVHIVGKEIIRFHCLYWPALLLSTGLALPRRVFAHGWLTNDGYKISKTTGNVIDPAALTREFGADAVRYYLLGAIPFGHDGDIQLAGLVARYNADLANDFGNLVQRATRLASQARATALPGQFAAPSPAEEELREHAELLAGRVETAYGALALHEAAAAVGEFVARANRYIEITAPWKLVRQGSAERLELVLDHAVEAARLAAWYYAPIIPRAAGEAHRRLSGTPPSPGQGVFQTHRPAHAVLFGPPLFPRRE